MKIDAKDKKILMILQKNARESLTNISRQIGLSVDAVHKRIKKLVAGGVISTHVAINPSSIGYPLITDIKVKLKDANQKDMNTITSYLKAHPRVIELMQIMGDWDLTCVIISKDANDLATVTNDIRYRFNKFIADWRAVIILKELKFEEYNMNKL